MRGDTRYIIFHYRIWYFLKYSFLYLHLLIMRILIIFISFFLFINYIFALGIDSPSTWNIQLQGKINSQRQFMSIDLFDTPTKKIADLQKQWTTVICYFSAGTYEDWRQDAGKFAPNDLGKTVLWWNGENWIDVRSNNIRDIMRSRISLAKSKWCNGVDPDNVNGHENDTGFPLIKEDMIAYNQFLIQEAKTNNLIIWLKNSQSLIPEIGSQYDFFINESCYRYKECDAYIPMQLLHKPVFIIEYGSYSANTCDKAKKSGFLLGFFRKALKWEWVLCK